MNPTLGPIPSGACIGLLGGGQLARMIVLAGHPLGFRFLVLDPGVSAPAAQVGARQIAASYSDPAALAEMACCCDLITYEFENIDADAVAWLEQRVELPQGSLLLRTAQNRLKEKRALSELNIPVTPFLEIYDEGRLQEALASFGRVVVKTVSGGFDGKGQRIIRREEEIPEAFGKLHRHNEPLVAEQMLDFERELSVIVARSRSGEVRCFPVAENLHMENILTISRIPARIASSTEDQVKCIAERIAKGLGLSGVMGVELFHMKNGDLLVNEIAPRPHNSGHFTQDACGICQFEQHLRAIAGWPMGSSELRNPAVMLNLLGDQLNRILEKLQFLPSESRLHVYGKSEARPGRKMGHLNLVSEDLQDLLDPLKRFRIWEPKMLESMLG